MRRASFQTITVISGTMCQGMNIKNGMSRSFFMTVFDSNGKSSKEPRASSGCIAGRNFATDFMWFEGYSIISRTVRFFTLAEAALRIVRSD